jgi:hypothetical protein
VGKFGTCRFWEEWGNGEGGKRAGRGWRRPPCGDGRRGRGVAGRKGESDGIKETGGAWLPPGMGRWGGRGLKRRGRRGGGFKGYERKGQSDPGGALRRLRVKLWLWHWWHHGVKIRPWLAVDGRVTDHGVIFLGGAEVHRGHVDEVRLGTRALVERRGACTTHRVAKTLFILVKAADPYLKRRRCRVGGFRDRYRAWEEKRRVRHGTLKCRVHRGGTWGAHDDAPFVQIAGS